MRLAGPVKRRLPFRCDLTSCVADNWYCSYWTALVESPKSPASWRS